MPSPVRFGILFKTAVTECLRLSSTNPHGCTKNPPNRKKTGFKSRIQLCHIQKLFISKFHSKIERSTHFSGHSCGNYYLQGVNFCQTSAPYLFFFCKHKNDDS